MNPNPLRMTHNTICAINGELTYQSDLPRLGKADNLDHGIEGQLVTLAVYTRRAQEAWTDSADKNDVLAALRKVAAIAVRALEQYGCTHRQGY